MNPAILARLFQAHADAVNSMNEPPPLTQEPGALQWGTGGGGKGLDVPGPDATPPSDDGTMPPSDYKYLDRVEGDDSPLGVMFDQQQGEPTGNGRNVPMSHLPPGAQEGQYISPLDMHGAAPASGIAGPATQGPMGAMFSPPPPPPPWHFGDPDGHFSHESRNSDNMPYKDRPDEILQDHTEGVQWGPNPYPTQQPGHTPSRGRRMSTRR